MSEYCGFICSDYVDKAIEIREAIAEFEKHNPKEAETVLTNVVLALLGREDRMETRRSQHRS